MSEEKKEGGEGKEKPVKKGGGLPLLPIMLAGVVVVNAATAFVLVQMTKPKPVVPDKTATAADSTHGEGESMHGEGGGESGHGEEAGAGEHGGGHTDISDPIDVLVNISGTDAERFMKIAVALEFNVIVTKGGGGGHGGAAKSPQKEALKKILPRLKNTLMEIVSPMTLEEILAPEGKSFIRKSYLKEVNKFVPAEVGKINEVFITDFIIQ